MRKTRCANCAACSRCPRSVIYLGRQLAGRVAEGDSCTRCAGDHAGVGPGPDPSWNSAGWFSLPQRLGDQMRPLIGAHAGRGGGHGQHLDQSVQGAQRRLARRCADGCEAQGDRQRTQQFPDRPVYRRVALQGARATGCAWRRGKDRIERDRGSGSPDAHSRQLPHRRDARHDGTHATRARTRRACRLGPCAFGGCGER